MTKSPKILPKEPAPPKPLPDALPLAPARPDSLDNEIVYANPNDLRRDLHTFVGYVSRREIKRSNRGNELPQADYKRLARLIDDNWPEEEGESAYGDSLYGHRAESYSWIYYLDRLALKMGFISYDTKGVYRGYSSVEPSFPDNLIHFNAEGYRTFLALPLAEQERRLLDTLVGDYDQGYNEFYTVGIRGRLDRFPSWGSALGVMPTLNVGDVRRFLLDALQRCEPGAWYNTADLVAYLKRDYPYFLIPPKKPAPAKAKPTRWPQPEEKRYGNFYENDHYSYNRDPIPDDAPDGFERVEGRYVERFLEGLPLTLGYVEVAYVDRPASAAGEGSSPKPSRGMLRAFRVNERLRQAWRGDIPQPRVTVQPNFEIYIESPFYPAHLVNRLAPLSDIVGEGVTTVLKLQKQKVAAQLAENPGLDVTALLTRLAGRELPQNVAVELQEWAGHADVFTLYDGFGLVESAGAHAAVDPFAAQSIGEGLRLVRDPDGLYAHLTRAGAIALRVRHPDDALAPLPAKARTVFPRKSEAAPKQGAKSAVAVQREVLIALRFSDDEPFEAFRKALADARCVFEVDKERRILTLSGKDEKHFKGVVGRLSDAYDIRVEDRA